MNWKVCFGKSGIFQDVRQLRMCIDEPLIYVEYTVIYI